MIEKKPSDHASTANRAAFSATVAGTAEMASVGPVFVMSDDFDNLGLQCLESGRRSVPPGMVAQPLGDSSARRLRAMDASWTGMLARSR